MNIVRAPFLLAYAGLVIALVAAVYTLSLRNNLALMERTANVRISQAADRLMGQLESYRELANFLARHPTLTAAALDRQLETSEFLLRQVLIAGAQTIYFMDRDGDVVASSNFEEAENLISRNFGARKDVQRAANGSLGVYHAVSADDLTRNFYFTRSAIGDRTSSLGFVTVKVDVAQLEFEWRIDEDVVAFVDEHGMIFSANRPGLILRRLTADASETQTGILTRYPPTAVRDFFPYTTTRQGPYDIWHFGSGTPLPQNALVFSRFIPTLDMSARVFMDLAPAQARAKLEALLAAASMALIGLVLLTLAQRRQALSDQLELEEAANARLEARVAERTLQLRQTQEDLVQASKLTALGELSAGISHELNQPLAAIQNFAANGTKLIDRDRVGEARENLTLITDQIGRIDRIITNLRAFARKETLTLDRIDIAQVIRDARVLVEPRLRSEAVELKLELPNTPIVVRAGAVRLQQVFLNLMGNAIDALEAQEDRRIWITVTEDSDDAVFTIRDNGPGLDHPEKVFEPFYTSKEVGASKGLGLGLSISYGIVGSFGGTLIAANAKDGGAIFTIRLKRVREA
ncbi:sensor histidine kinase [Litoreibacter roseus]|uniref:C4-dicarboxylate transport sensor protein DctB n=1 Tax=Litoreibacter roseus TaxID=2601869 RepID=A0A6N6JDN3_9RHOB|nr:ATP-binding protein [Litoreibacter roseus]GFE64077.1 two-component sensor histidine kinase [Litoreibacter roseus]